MDEEVVLQAHATPALEVVSYLRSHGIAAVILEDMVPDTLHYVSGGYQLLVAVPQEDVARARELLTVRDGEHERNAAALLREMRGQLALCATLTTLAVGGYASATGRWDWSYLGAALWVFLGILAVLGLSQRIAIRRKRRSG
jgi:hypothetical protein